MLNSALLVSDQQAKHATTHSAAGSAIGGRSRARRESRLSSRCIQAQRASAWQNWAAAAATPAAASLVIGQKMRSLAIVIGGSSAFQIRGSCGIGKGCFRCCRCRPETCGALQDIPPSSPRSHSSSSFFLFPHRLLFVLLGLGGLKLGHHASCQARVASKVRGCPLCRGIYLMFPTVFPQACPLPRCHNACTSTQHRKLIGKKFG